MKRIVFTIVASVSAFGTMVAEVVYLKNGSEIKGEIVEQTVGESIKFRTADGSLFVFKYGEMTKITNGDAAAMDMADYAAGAVRDIEGNVYRTVVIGGREWMAENLRTASYADGTPVGRSIVGDEEMTGRYGRMYSFASATRTDGVYGYVPQREHQGVCPDGWHLPAAHEVHALLGGDPRNMKASRRSSLKTMLRSREWAPAGLWSDGGNDAWGFGALPAGYAVSPKGKPEYTYREEGRSAYFMLADLSRSLMSPPIQCFLIDPALGFIYAPPVNRELFASVRCVKNRGAD